MRVAFGAFVRELLPFESELRIGASAISGFVCPK